MMLPPVKDRACQCPRVGYLPVLFEDAMQILFGIGLQYALSGQFLSAVHTHIERTFKPEGKPPRRLIDLITADAKIGKQTIDLCDTLEAEKA